MHFLKFDSFFFRKRLDHLPSYLKVHQMSMILYVRKTWTYIFFYIMIKTNVIRYFNRGNVSPRRYSTRSSSPLYEYVRVCTKTAHDSVTTETAEKASVTHRGVLYYGRRSLLLLLLSVLIKQFRTVSILHLRNNNVYTGTVYNIHY